MPAAITAERSDSGRGLVGSPARIRTAQVISTELTTKKMQTISLL